MYEEYYDAFRQSPFCQNMTPEEYDLFLQKVKPAVKHYNKGDLIVREGDKVEGCFMVVRGMVLQFRNNRQGEKSVYSSVPIGQMFGEIVINLPLRTGFSTDYLAKTNSTLLYFPKKTLDTAFLDPEIFSNRIYLNYVYCICKFVEQQMIALRSLRNTTVRKKISTYLYEMYVYLGKTQLELPLNRTELAAYLFMPQSSLSRELASMKRDGLIDYHKDTIKILRLEELQC